MSHQRWHAIEKIQVEIAAAVALAAMYFLIWPFLKPWDADGVVAFLPLGAFGRLAEFILAVWLLAGVSALLTVSARPEGALLATLAGAGGASLHSEPMRLLLMRFEHDLSGLLLPAALELACMISVVLGATVVIQLVRGLVTQVRPGWVWRPVPLLGGVATGQTTQPPTGWADVALFLLVGRVPLRWVHDLPTRRMPSKAPTGEAAVNMVACGGLTLLLGLLLMIGTLFSTDRGQIIFSLALSFFLAAGVASYFFPVRFSTPCWIAPVLLGIAAYLKLSSMPFTGVLTWGGVDAWGHILPVDWISAGCGGAVGGYWLSCRLHDLKHLPEEGGVTDE